MPGWRDRLRATLTRGRTRPGDVYEDLRSLALTVDPRTIQRPDGEQWSGALVAMIEFGLAKGSVTFVAIADGTASMYTSAGGGVLGAGEHAADRAAADRFRATLAGARADLQPSNEFPGPLPGEVRFQLVIEDGGYTGTAAESALASGRHPLSESYAAGQDLVSEIRRASPG